MPKEETTGNSGVEEALSGDTQTPDSGDFFQQLENDVNGVVADSNIPQTEQVTPQQVDPKDSGENVGKTVSDSDIETLKKRYSDSSREAQRMRAQLNELKPFNSLLTAMKNDSGLVEHVRDYFEGGGITPKNMQQKLNLAEDFEFDAHEAVTNPNSDSSRVMDEIVSKKVQAKLSSAMDYEKAKAKEIHRRQGLAKHEADFKNRHNMSDADFNNLKAAAQERVLTLDDVYYLINKDKVNKNVAKDTKTDMLNQMKNVRNIPTSQSGTNSTGTANDPNKDVFDSILGLDNDADNLFG